MATKFTADELTALEKYATPHQISVLRAVAEKGGRPAARALGVSESTVRGCIDRVLRKAARAEPSLHTHTAPAGYHLRGASTLIDADGNVRLQWVKTAADHADPEALIAAFKAAVEAAEVPRRAPVKRDPGKLLTDRMAVYPLGDPHIGMLAWGTETGADFDLEIAERLLLEAVDHLSDLAPRSETALVINVGDFFHTDNELARTSRSDAALDADSRYSKILRVGTRAMVRCIDRTLEKHAKVRVINAKGNHDDSGSQYLSLILDAYYRNEPRVSIDISPSPYYWHRFGSCLIGVTHGHGPKHADLAGIMACDRARDWGETTHRHWYTGHYHHTKVQDFRGCTVEVLRTLAARDAWHHAQGYRSPRSMQLDVWHETRGRILQHHVDVEALP